MQQDSILIRMGTKHEKSFSSRIVLLVFDAFRLQRIKTDEARGRRNLYGILGYET